MKSELKSSDGLIREIEIEIDTEKVQTAFNETYHRYQKEAKIKGFRPGKTPMNIIKSKFREAIREDVLAKLVEDSYPKAIKEHNLNIVSQPGFPDFELEEGKPLKYTAKVEVMPEIDSLNYDGIEIPEINIEVRDSEVDVVVQHLRKKHAENKTVDRPAQENDIILADLEKLEDKDNILQENQYKDTLIDLSSNITVKEFKEILPGIKAGEVREVVVKYPEDYGNTNLAGKSLKYQCTAKEIKESILPEENDDFAKKVGEVETMSELRLKIHEDLTKQKEMDQGKYTHNLVQKIFLEKNPIPVPETMVQKYLDSVIEDSKKKQPDLDEKILREQYKEHAVNNMRWTILTNRLADMEKIEVSTEDTEKWVKRFADNYSMDIEQAKKALAKSGQVQEIRDSILEDKILKFLMTKVTYIPAQKKDEKNNITEEH